MKRRQFLAASAVAALALAASPNARAADAPGDKEGIELRIYHFASPAKQQAFEKFMAQAAIPAYNRLGIQPVGVLKMLAKDNQGLKLDADPTDLYVILPHKSAESLLTMETRLAADEAYQKAGASILITPQNDPAYTRYETSLLLGFDQCPTVQQGSKAETRVLQLRIYPSHSNDRALKKIHMFNEGGEIAIFKRCGMMPVFFGQTLAGSNMPNLTYMLSFDDEKAQAAAWGKFGQDPDWKKISKDDFYKETVIQNKIINLILRPAAGSQI
ncbi:MAG: NIPSNAP family protein [Tepidisphaerales bacterium]